MKKKEENNLVSFQVASQLHHYVDTHGRARIFHGTNAVNKAHPYYFDYLLDDARLDDLQKWGFNILRSDGVACTESVFDYLPGLILPILLIGKSCLCGDSRFPLKKYVTMII